ncbi:hypothetical protein D3C79_852750 [compost metagenome]
MFGAKLYRAVAEHGVGCAVTGIFELDVDAFGAQRGGAETGQLVQPAADDRIHHETVVTVVGADGVEAQPGTLSILVETRLTAIVGAIQGFESNQAARCLPHRRCLRGSDAGQAGLTQAAELAHL